jgi:hypothetical protein
MRRSCGWWGLKLSASRFIAAAARLIAIVRYPHGRARRTELERASGLSGSRRCCCARSWQTCSDGRCARRTIDSEMASCRQDTAGSSARYIALAPALCGRMSRLSRFRLRRRRRCVPRDTKMSRSGFRPTAISAHNLDLNDFVAADCAFSNRCCVARVDKSKNSLVCSVACAVNF